MDALEFGVGDHPFLGAAAAAGAFLGVDAAETAPFADGEFGFAEEAGDIGGGVEILDRALLEQS